MTITTNEARELKKRITKLVKAEVAHSWKGSDRAEAHAQYDEELRVARRRLNTLIGGLIHEGGPRRLTEDQISDLGSGLYLTDHETLEDYDQALARVLQDAIFGPEKS